MATFKPTGVQDKDKYGMEFEIVCENIAIAKVRAIVNLKNNTAKIKFCKLYGNYKVSNHSAPLDLYGRKNNIKLFDISKPVWINYSSNREVREYFKIIGKETEEISFNHYSNG